MQQRCSISLLEAYLVAGVHTRAQMNLRMHICTSTALTNRNLPFVHIYAPMHIWSLKIGLTSMNSPSAHNYAPGYILSFLTQRVLLPYCVLIFPFKVNMMPDWLCEEIKVCKKPLNPHWHLDPYSTYSSFDTDFSLRSALAIIETFGSYSFFALIGTSP